jgi:hypothetical protein
MQTMNMLSPILLTVSDRTLHRFTETLSRDHDQQVIEWWQEWTQILKNSKVNLIPEGIAKVQSNTTTKFPL